MTYPTEPWRDAAACKGMDTNIFFSEGLGKVAKAQQAEAAKVCATCTVTAECLDYAIRHQEPVGVWGGMGVNRRIAYAKGAAFRKQRDES